MADLIFKLWWVLPVLAALLAYKFVLRVFFGMIIVPDDRIGLVVKKFALVGADKRLPDGRISATRGEAGMQAKPLAPGFLPLAPMPETRFSGDGNNGGAANNNSHVHIFSSDRIVHPVFITPVRPSVPTARTFARYL